jgi:hypothetical protein
LQVFWLLVLPRQKENRHFIELRPNSLPRSQVNSH